MTHVFRRNPRDTYPVALRGEGAYLIDREGKRYLDASGGAAVSCLGHSDREVMCGMGRCGSLEPARAYRSSRSPSPSAR